MSRVTPKRDKQVRFTLSAEEKDMLREIADDDGLTVSDVIRQWIRRRHQLSQLPKGRVIRDVDLAVNVPLCEADDRS